MCMYAYISSYCPTADVFYSRAGNAAAQWSGGLDGAMGLGGSSLTGTGKTDRQAAR